MPDTDRDGKREQASCCTLGFWADQTDSLSQRDTGWIQFYAENGQEALDSIIQAYKIAEQVYLPAMVVIEAFFVSHFMEPIDIPDLEVVDRFLARSAPTAASAWPHVRARCMNASAAKSRSPIGRVPRLPYLRGGLSRGGLLRRGTMMTGYGKYLTLAREWLVAYGLNLLLALVILVLGRWLVKWGTYFFTSALKRAGLDATLVRFLEKIIYYTLLVAVIIAAADQAGIKTTSFLAILGAAGLAVGLALKDSLANFASGVLLIIFQPFRVGDTVTVAGVLGTVERIDIFSSILITPDNQKIIVPNSFITSAVITNITAQPTRLIYLRPSWTHRPDLSAATAPTTNPKKPN